MMRRLTDVGKELADAIMSQATDGLDRSDFTRKRAREYLKMDAQPSAICGSASSRWKVGRTARIAVRCKPALVAADAEM
jgi:hypothetical protein